MRVLLTCLLLCSCAPRVEPPLPVKPAPEIAAKAADPTVKFRVYWLASHDSTAIFTPKIVDYTLTLAEAQKLGIPPELFILAIMPTKSDELFPVVLFWRWRC